MTLTVDSSRNNLQDTFIINPEGAKNAILPLMVSKLLVPGKTIFTNVPTGSEDVKTMIQILELLGLSCKSDRETLEIENPGTLKDITIPDELASKTRYSSLLLGALGAFGCDFRIPLPGGCHLQEKRPLWKKLK